MNQSATLCVRNMRSWQQQWSREPTGDIFCSEWSNWRPTSIEREQGDSETICLHQRQKDFSANEWTSFMETVRRLWLLQLRTGLSRWNHRGTFFSTLLLRTATATSYTMRAWQRRWCSWRQTQIRSVSCQRSSRLTNPDDSSLFNRAFFSSVWHRNPQGKWLWVLINATKETDNNVSKQLFTSLLITSKPRHLYLSFLVSFFWMVDIDVMKSWKNQWLLNSHSERFGLGEESGYVPLTSLGASDSWSFGAWAAWTPTLTMSLIFI